MLVQSLDSNNFGQTDSPRYFFAENGESFGPYSRIEMVTKIINGELGVNHYLFGPGAGDWQKYSDAACQSVLGLQFEKPSLRWGKRYDLLTTKIPTTAMLHNTKHIIQAKINDISVSGAYVTTTAFPFHLNERVNLAVKFTNQQKAFKIDCEVVRLSYKDSNGYGLRFI